MSLSGNSSATLSNYRENFFSLDDIIATHEKISCKFEVPVPHLGKSYRCHGTGPGPGPNTGPSPGPGPGLVSAGPPSSKEGIA